MGGDEIRKETSIDSPSSSKRASLQRYRMVDIDDSSNPDDDHAEELSPEPSNKTNKTKLFPHPLPLLSPYHNLSEDHERKTFASPNRLSLPRTPYSATSDPGPYHSPWLNTPTSAFNFRFPHPQEPSTVHAQGTIAQLSTLTQMLCDEPSVFTPISPRYARKSFKCIFNTMFCFCRFKKEKSHPAEAPSILTCQICREEFDSHQL